MWCKESGQVLSVVCSLGLFTSSLLIGSTMGSSKLDDVILAFFSVLAYGTV